MKKIFVTAPLMWLLFSSCTKTIETDPIKNYSKVEAVEKSVSFTSYTINKGGHNCDKNTLSFVQTNALQFMVRFDNSAKYSTADPKNQYDINKLYGFSDNQAQHHMYSARFGWRYSDNALRLFAYVYNNGVRSFKEIRMVRPGFKYTCSIKVEGDKYLFNAGGIEVTMPRHARTPKAMGYKLYPYFGGDEVAPHEMVIEIADL